MRAATKRKISRTVSTSLRDQWAGAKTCPKCGSRFRGRYERLCWRCR